MYVILSSAIGDTEKSAPDEQLGMVACTPWNWLVGDGVADDDPGDLVLPAPVELTFR
jgi:hypothetical protein